MITRHPRVTETLEASSVYQVGHAHEMGKREIGIRSPSMSDLPGLADNSHKIAQLANHNPSTGQDPCMTLANRQPCG